MYKDATCDGISHENNPELSDYPRHVLQCALLFSRSTFPGKRGSSCYLSPEYPITFYQGLEERFRTILKKYQVDNRNGIVIGGKSLEYYLWENKPENTIRSNEDARNYGFLYGAREASDWIGITKEKWSCHSFEVCALQALSAAEGVPNSLQFNNESSVGAKFKGGFWGGFKYGETNGIWMEKGSKPLYLRNTPRNFRNQISQSYREGVETAFLHYVAVGGPSRLINGYASQLSSALNR